MSDTCRIFVIIVMADVSDTIYGVGEAITRRFANSDEQFPAGFFSQPNVILEIPGGPIKMPRTDANGHLGDSGYP